MLIIKSVAFIRLEIVILTRLNKAFSSIFLQEKQIIRVIAKFRLADKKQM